MSEPDRGAYAPPTDAPLTFDARQPVRGARPLPFTLIISILVLAGLGTAIFMFYRSGVRHAGQAPQAVGQPVTGMKAPPPAEAQPRDPAAGLQIYNTERNQAPPPAQPRFTEPPEAPLPRVATQSLPPAVAAAPAPTLRPAIPAEPPAAKAAPKAAEPAPKSLTIAAPAPKPVAAPPPKAAATPAPKALPPAAKAPPAPAKEAVKAPPAAAAPATPAAKGAAAVQIGAFSSQTLADKGWNDAAALAPGLAAGKGKSVEKIDKDGKILFRTQVTGFASRADATAFCDKLKAAGKACFVK